MTRLQPNRASRFAGRVAVVTGSTRGIGRAIAMRLAAEGAFVVVNGRDEAALADTVRTVREAGGQAEGVRGSVSDGAVAPTLVATAVRMFGRLDLLVSNAAVSPYFGPLTAVGKDAFAKTLVGNTWPAIDLVQAALESDFGHNRGAVLTVSSIGARQTQPHAAPYAAAKAALESLTSALARELAARQIRVNAIAPGVVRTRTSQVLWADDDGAGEQNLVPMGRLGEPEDVAAAAAFLLSPEASWITGSTLVIDGGRLLVGGENSALFGVLPTYPEVAHG